MAEDKRYSIISVADDEDEDVVIQAGVVAGAEDELERLRETERQLAAKPEQSRMHKIVLALFALGVVVFAVCYYVFFMA